MGTRYRKGERFRVRSRGIATPPPLTVDRSTPYENLAAVAAVLDAPRRRGDEILAAVAARLPNATIEYPGFLAHPSDLDGLVWAFGTANPTWGGDLAVVDTGEPVCTVVLADAQGAPIASTCEDSDAISDAILRAMVEGEQIAIMDRTHPGATWHYVTHPTAGRVLVSVPK
jgi:hypothetical protein